MSGLFAKAKGPVGDNLDKAKDLLGNNADKVDDAVDKVAGVVDDKTGRRHAKKIDDGAEKTKDTIAKFAGDGK